MRPLRAGYTAQGGDRAQYWAGRAVTEAGTESSWLNRRTAGGAQGKGKALQRAEEESAGKTGLGGEGGKQWVSLATHL